MNELLQNLIEALREELKQYGEMLALLDHQQQLVALRHSPDLLQCAAALDSQAEAIRIARREREQRRRHLARTLKLDEAASFNELTSHIHYCYRPLLEALLQENNELLIRVHQRARQNHLVLSRAVQLMQRFITTFCSGSSPGANIPGCGSLAHILAQGPITDAPG
jgi:hypothetical protein